MDDYVQCSFCQEFLARSDAVEIEGELYCPYCAEILPPAVDLDEALAGGEWNPE